MRAALAVCVLLAVACTAPVGYSSPSPTPSHKVVPTSGGVIEYAVPDPAPPGEYCVDCGLASLGGIVAAGDGNLWFLDAGHRAVGRITLSGFVTEFNLPAIVGDPYAITVGPDGAAWVTASTFGKGKQDWIVRVSRDGAFTQFPAGIGTSSLNEGTGPESITMGPDGNLWFPEFWTNRVGRMAPTGVLTEFPIPTPDSSPRQIVAGPDGNLWFAESSRVHPAIARITPAGVVTEFVVNQPTPTDTTPWAIAAGPDGNLWFTGAQGPGLGANLGRITPKGVVTKFALPAGSAAGGLVAGPDGNLWFTDGTGNSIGRMSMKGDFRLYALPRRNAGPGGITTGPDGRMWFTENSRIASIGTTVPEASLSSRLLTFAPGSGPNTRSVTITNTGDAALKVASTAIVGLDHPEFATVRDDCSGHTVAVKGSCRVDVTFEPGADTGVRAARLRITDNASGSPQSVSLVAQLPMCGLPLFQSTASVAKGQFLTPRDGGVVDDPKGSFVLGATLPHSEAAPVLSGQLPASFDRAADRWVPAGIHAISPDGSRYAYTVYQQPGQALNVHVHVVNVASGRDNVLPLPDGLWSVIGFTSEGIYVDQRYEGIGPGLVLVNPDSGAMRTIFGDAAVDLVSGQVAWIEARDSSDPLPQPPGIGGANNEIQSRDLTTLKTTTWLYRPGSSLMVVGVGNGSIVVRGYDRTTSFLLVLTGPGQAQEMTSPDSTDPPAFSSGLIADGNGWWIGSADGLYLWTAHTGAILVSESVAAPAGACA